MYPSYRRPSRRCILCDRAQDWRIRLNGHNRCGECAKLIQKLGRIGRRKGFYHVSLEGQVVFLRLRSFVLTVARLRHV